MADEQPTGEFFDPIPPGWDFPEARRAAERGVDLWLLDSNLKLTPWQRIEQAFSVSELAETLRQGLETPTKTADEL